MASLIPFIGPAIGIGSSLFGGGGGGSTASAPASSDNTSVNITSTPGIVVGAGASAAGGALAAQGANQGANTSLTGYNYLNGSPTNSAIQTAGVAGANTATGVQGQEASLLGLAPMTQQAQSGFNNYLNSTGYNFQKQQGDTAITGSQAAKGLLNSGSTGQALQTFGQGLAQSGFNNYLTGLNNLGAQGQASANAANTATGQIGAAGTTGGIAAGNQQASAGVDLGNAATTSGAALGSAVNNLLSPSGSNISPSQAQLAQFGLNNSSWGLSPQTTDQQAASLAAYGATQTASNPNLDFSNLNPSNFQIPSNFFGSL